MTCGRWLAFSFSYAVRAALVTGAVDTPATGTSHHDRLEGGAGVEGLTTISSFGGSVANVVNAAATSVTEVFAAPEKPATRTIMVTRGQGESQSYNVPSQGN